MRIGLLTTSFPRFEGDVAGSFVLGFARALVARGHVIRVLAPEPLEPQAPPAFEGIDTRFVAYARPRTLERTFYGAGVLDNARDLRAWPGLLTFPPALLLTASRALADCDALVSHFALPCGLVAGALARLWSRPHLAVLHSADLHALERLPGRSALASALVRSAGHLSCVSGGHRDRLLALLPDMLATRAAERVHVQPMGTDTTALDLRGRDPDAHRYARRKLGLSRFTLLTLARLVPVKGLLEALAALRGRDDLEWVIGGEGPLRGALERAAAEHGVCVRLVGEVRGDAKLQWLAAADALLLPSRVLASGRTEGAPLAVLEAFAAGLPVIASDVGGVRELVRDRENGLLFDPLESRTLRAALDQLAASSALADALVAHGRITAQAYDWRVIAPRVERWLGYDHAR